MRIVPLLSHEINNGKIIGSCLCLPASISEDYLSYLYTLYLSFILRNEVRFKDSIFKDIRN